jgi:hypothetical protein
MVYNRKKFNDFTTACNELKMPKTKVLHGLKLEKNIAREMLDININ